MIAFLAVPSFAEEAKVSPTPTVQKTEQGVTFSLQQLLPDQVNAFYLGRGFTSEQIKSYVESCVYTAVLRNDNVEERIHFVRSGWNVKTNDASQTIKTNAEWLTEFTQQQTTPAALLAFDLAARGYLKTLGRAAVGFHLWHHGAFLTVRLAPLEGRAL